MKKGIMIFIDFIITVVSIFLLCTITYADGMKYDLAISEEFIEELKSGEIMSIRRDNSIFLTNYDEIATSGIRYKTLGYGIKKKRTMLLKR